MADATYPYGYSGTPQGMGQMLTFEQMLARTTVAKMHPEFRRRVFALMRYCTAFGFPLGIGTAYRSYAQQEALHKNNPSGSAPPGNSNHEGNNSADDKDAIAADMVPQPSWPFMIKALPAFGLIAFKSSTNPADWNLVDNRSYSAGSTQEWWHIQPKEVTYGRRGRTTRAFLPTWPIDPMWLSDNPQPEPPQEDEMTPVNKRVPGTFTLNGGPNSGITVPLPDARGRSVAQVSLKTLGTGSKPGFLAVSANGQMPGTSAADVQPGKWTYSSTFTAVNGDGAINVYIGGEVGVAAQLIVDVEGVG